VQEACSIRAELARRLAGQRSRSAGLRVIPMIDLFFLLLAFFILTGSYKPADDFLPFVLPKVGGGGVSVVEPLVLNIRGRTGGCNVHIGQGAGVIVKERDAEMAMARFAIDLEEVMKRQRRTSTDPVEIVCENEVEWQYLVKVYDVLYGMGITDITFRMTE